MHEQLDGLLTQYEQGRITRREMLLGMTVLAAAPAAMSAAQSPIGTVTSLNHVTVFVPDVQKSVRFYQDLLGLKVLTKQDAGINLAAGSGFLGIYPARGAATGSINHVCFGMENFDAQEVSKRLAERGVKANIRMRGETPELYFDDVDGIRVQLQDQKYKGGVGVLGDRDP
jgi:catechol 2,3-dioxygenase-like lactoylglutathione lyase family enzyme